jgi:hypothetical protein
MCSCAHMCICNLCGFCLCLVRSTPRCCFTLSYHSLPWSPISVRGFYLGSNKKMIFGIYEITCYSGVGANAFWDGKVLCDLDISGFIVCRFIQRTYCISHPKKRPFAFIWDVLWVRELGLYGSLWQILHSRLEYYTSKSQRKCQIIVQLSLCAWFLVFFLPMLRLFYPLCFSS